MSDQRYDQERNQRFNDERQAGEWRSRERFLRDDDANEGRQRRSQSSQASQGAFAGSGSQDYERHQGERRYPYERDGARYEAERFSSERSGADRGGLSSDLDRFQNEGGQTWASYQNEASEHSLGGLRSYPEEGDDFQRYGQQGRNRQGGPRAMRSSGYQSGSYGSHFGSRPTHRESMTAEREHNTFPGYQGDYQGYQSAGYGERERGMGPDYGRFDGSNLRGSGSGMLQGSTSGSRMASAFGYHQHEPRFAGKGPKGYQRSDERIREEVCDALSDHPEIDASDVEVKVESCEVTLTGTVDCRWAKRLIEDTVHDVRGVRDVSNQLKVQSDSQKSQLSQNTGVSHQAGQQSVAGHHSSSGQGTQNQPVTPGIAKQQKASDNKLHA